MPVFDLREPIRITAVLPLELGDAYRLPEGDLGFPRNRASDRA